MNRIRTTYPETVPDSTGFGDGGPLSIVREANDPRVPRSEAEQLVDWLTDRGVEHGYLRFEDEGHGAVRTENCIEHITRTVEFFGANR